MYRRYYDATPYRQAPPQRFSAPMSVQLAAVLMYLIGLLLLAGAALLVAFGRGVLDLPASMPDAVRARDAVVAAVVVLAVLALCWLFVGRKVQRGRQWARVLVVVLSLLSVLANGWQLYAVGVRSATASPLVVPVLLLILVNTGNARSWFSYRTY